MNYILFGDSNRNNLLPFTFMRPMCDIRVGILTIREKWEKYLGEKTSTLTEPYLNEKYPLVKQEDNMLINSSYFPNQTLLHEISLLKPKQALVQGETIVALRLQAQDIENMELEFLDGLSPLETNANAHRLTNLWEIVTFNEQAIRDDFELLTRDRQSQPLPQHVRVINPEKVFVEPGAIIEMAYINASEGPVYIAKDSHVMDGAMLRGPVGVGEGATVKMGAKIYPGSSIGPHSKVGGEMSQSVIFAYSNKAHDGFLGHSAIGEWCNLGADTNTSNLKNNYETVRLWNYPLNSFVNTGQQFIGTFMADHSKCGINTMLNTGTVIGIYAQVFGTGFMRNFIPSFTWGSPSGFSTVDLNKAVDTAKRVFARRGLEFDQTEQNILKHVFDQTLVFRRM
jgi:UDP-N-acetylglucosamine diphosphorylase/glucosamine-1-phosphate N-acetyltransferase